MRIRSFLLAGLAVIATSILAVQGQTPGVNSNLATVFSLIYEASTTKPTYSASIAGLASPSGGGDICSLYGSATKTLRVRRVLVGGVSAALQTDPVSIIKRSTISNGGTVDARGMPVVAYDSTFPASTVITDPYTTVPTSPGTLVGVLADLYIVLAGATTAVASPPMTVFTFGQLGSPVVLRGVTQSINVNTQLLAAFTAACTFEWTEE